MHKLLQSLARRLLLPLLLTAAAAGAAAAPVYRAHVIAAPYRLGGVEYFWYTAMGLNNQGQSLLTSYQYGSYGNGYVVYDKQGQYQRHVGGMSRYGANLAVAINNHGDVAGHEWAGHYWIGRVQKDQGFDATIHGFPEGDFGGYFSDAYAYGLSDAGHVAGQAVGALDGRQRGYVWQLGTMQEIGTFGGATSTAFAVSDQGIAVGQADLADGSVHAFAFRGGVLHDLGTLGGANSWARDINDRGQIAGTAETADGSLRAFVYEKRQMRALPTPEGASASAWSINRQGQVVGGYTLGEQGHAFLFDGGTVHRIQDLLRPVDQAVWTIAGAASINDRGWILVDAHRAGDEHSTVLLLKPVR
jgi:probable HAF family extracellular repeat protein